MTLCDNLKFNGNSICINAKSWNDEGSLTVYSPSTEGVEYMDEKGTFMIPFDMEASGQTLTISKTHTIRKASGTSTIETSTSKLTSTISISIKEVSDGDLETGHIIIKGAKAQGIATKGFYLHDIIPETAIGKTRNGTRISLFQAKSISGAA